MGDTAQKRAIENYRARLTKRGIARFEVLGLDADRELIRALARRLAEDNPDARRIRASVGRTIAGGAPSRGGILEALRRSPLAGAGLKLIAAVAAANECMVVTDNEKRFPGIEVLNPLRTAQ